jgi:hypothetical protein
MGRPIQKKWFGQDSGAQIIVDAVKFADGSVATDAFIVKQTGSNAYVVQDAAQTHSPETVFMVNVTSAGDLAPGQCFVTATPFGGSALACEKIAQYRVGVFEADGRITNYSWSTQPADAAGQADLIRPISF